MRKKLGKSSKKRIDYYPFGMPMPNRNVEGNYRYKFQGQEKDSETGKEAFELRLWDGRIGRWLTTDPKGQYHSPYMGMDNRPHMSIDPDGGSTEIDPKFFIKAAEYLKAEFPNWQLGGVLSEVFISNQNSLSINVNGRELNSPVGNARVSSQFLAERECNPCSQTHGGTDYAVPVGTPVNATANGVVARSYSSSSYGNTVVVDHGASSLDDGTNVFTLYAHGSSRLVENGATVTVGQPILASGNTGNSTGPHLHYEVIVTHLRPHQRAFFGNLNMRRAPSELGGLIGN